jgi:glycosyltransferase involved in cell wall biosynthesis
VPSASPVRRPPRLLLSAYAASPVRGSEAAVGWNRALQAARYGDVWLICEETEFGPEIREYLDKHGPIRGLEFVFVPMHPTWRKLGNYSALWYLALRQWQKKVLRVAERLHAKIGFDLTHHVTFCGYREPGYLWKLGVPHVWGPVGGVQNHPNQFLLVSGLSGMIREGGRNLLNSLQLATSRRVREAGRRSAAVIAANRENQRGLERILGKPLRQMSDVGMTASLAAGMVDVPTKSRAPNEPLRILWSGWMTPNKALHLLLRAAAMAAHEIPLEITVLGKGSEEQSNRTLASRLGIADRVHFRGWLPHLEALRCYEEAHCFAFTSLRDTTGTVLLEAMSRGTPPVCLDHQGASELVTSESGVRIPVTNPEQVTADFSAALLDLYRDNTRLRTLSQGAKRRAAEFTWDAQGTRMAEVYRQLIAPRASELALRSDLTEELTRRPPQEERSIAGMGESLKW